MATTAVRARAAPGGFTLIEVIVGMLVASIALAAGFATLGFVSDRSRAAEVATVEALEGAAGRALLVEWLAGARLSSPYRTIRGLRLRSDDEGDDRAGLEVNWLGNFEGRDAQEHGLDGDEIVFPTTARTPLLVPNAVVRLYIDVAAETPERGLVAELTERPLDVPRRVELLPAVAAMEIRYLPDVDGGIDDVQWENGWTSRNGLPKAVEITLVAAVGDSLPPLLRYPIRVPLGTLR